ncbi:MAG: hypothetical protein SGARI_002689, partial [Bacillariaceae sp.]
FECPDEEECEIDWDRMPFDDNDDANDTPSTAGSDNLQTSSGGVSASTSDSNTNNLELSVEEYTNIGDEDPKDDLQPQSYEHQVANSLEKSRVFYEMSWQVQECEVEEDRCSDFCPDCAGSGRSFCKLCRGTRTIAFGSDFRTCIMCDEDGKTECASCRGSGQIAPWVKTAAALDDLSS